MNIQWYPGHMAKAKRMIAEHIKLVDIVLELVDARAPLSSQNRDFQDLFAHKNKIMLLNKSDLADPDVTKQWLSCFKGENTTALAINSESGQGIGQIASTIQQLMKDKIETNRQKGMSTAVRAMIIGIPNVGKSSCINRLSRRSVTKVGDRPGVTTQKQWIKISRELELLDTPGVLVPKFDDQAAALRLAYTGAIKDDILDTEEVATSLLAYMAQWYPDNLCERYKLTVEEIADKKGYELLSLICQKRGFILSKEEYDYLRGANVLLDEFRAGKIGRLSLERP